MDNFQISLFIACVASLIEHSTSMNNIFDFVQGFENKYIRTYLNCSFCLATLPLIILSIIKNDVDIFSYSYLILCIIYFLKK